MNSPSPDDDPDDGPSTLHPFRSFVILVACVGLPFLTSVTASPYVGPAVAVGSFWTWRRYGPPAFPGLLPGCLFLLGNVAILGSLGACLLLMMERG